MSSSWLRICCRRSDVLGAGGAKRSNFKRVLRKYRTDVEPEPGDEGERQATG